MKKTIKETRTLYLADEKLDEARKDLLALKNPSSLCYNDGYYANSLVAKYGMPISDLEKLIGTPRVSITWD